MSRKGENIYKRKDGRWEGRYKKGKTAEGRTLYGSCYGRTYRETKVSENQIEELNKYIQTNLSITESFISFAGYDERVYNCTNHLNDILFSNQKNLIDISKLYANLLFDNIQQHLFNIASRIFCKKLAQNSFKF